jgi:hypothetical protein
MHHGIVTTPLCPNNSLEHVLAKLRNPQPKMPQWKVTLATAKKKPEKFLVFSARANYDTGCGQCKGGFPVLARSSSQLAASACI